MNNSSGDEQVECPLCMEPLEVDDLNFYPCTCGYQICRFCWHRIRTDENELCPACRKAYPENPADFTPLSQEQIAAFKAEKRQRDQQRRAKISENRKHLANVRVVQKNLVFVVGLPPRLADPEILKKHEYFGKYGKIHKVVINPSTTYAGVQGPSASAYVTYINNNDALRAIQSVNNIMIDGRLIKTSLGTTKYCSHFMKNQTCPKPDCMSGGGGGTSASSNTTSGSVGKGTCKSASGSDMKQISDITNGPIPSKEAWPSLSTTPNGSSNKENKLNGKTAVNGSGSSNKENTNRTDRKHETKSRTKGGKNKQQQQQQQQHNNKNSHENSSNHKDSTSNVTSANGVVAATAKSASAASLVNGKGSKASANGNNGKQQQRNGASGHDVHETAIVNGNSKEAQNNTKNLRQQREREREQQHQALLKGEEQQQQQTQGKKRETNGISNGSTATSISNGTANGNGHIISNDLDDDDDELDFEDLDNDALSSDNDGKTDSPSLSSSASSRNGVDSETASGKSTPGGFVDTLSSNGDSNVINAVPDGEVAAVSTTDGSETNAIPKARPDADAGESNRNSSSPSSSSSMGDEKADSESTVPVASSSSTTTSLYGGLDDGAESNAAVISASLGKLAVTDNTNTGSNGGIMNHKFTNELLDMSSRYSKLDSILDDNSSFFSYNAFDPYGKPSVTGATDLGVDSGSKILPFMNGGGMQQMPNGQQPQQPPQNGNWNQQMQQPFLGYQQNEHMAPAQQPNGLNKAGE
uniref:CCR4-NOT transcription complex subunit 4 n=1 Tax=Anopheles maculatus TaxID=74869 RepID=A0A182SSK4_9DIPT